MRQRRRQRKRNKLRTRTTSDHDHPHMTMWLPMHAGKGPTTTHRRPHAVGPHVESPVQARTGAGRFRPCPSGQRSVGMGGATAHRWMGCPWILAGLPRWPKGNTLMGWWGIAKRNEHNHSGSSAPPAPLRQTAVRDFRTAMEIGWQSECKPQTRLSIGRIRITKGRTLNLLKVKSKYIS